MGEWPGQVSPSLTERTSGQGRAAWDQKSRPPAGFPGHLSHRKRVMKQLLFQLLAVKIQVGELPGHALTQSGARDPAAGACGAEQLQRAGAALAAPGRSSRPARPTFCFVASVKLLRGGLRASGCVSSWK